MGFKMKGPSLYKPKMKDMAINKDYDKKADDRATSSPYQKKPHSMAGQMNAKKTKIVDANGNWRPLTPKEKANLKKNTPVKPKEGDMEKYSDLEKYDDDRG